METSGIEITPKQFMAQWVDLPHKFQLNIWNFEIKAGRKADEIFRKSFVLKRFNDKTSTPWQPRSKKSKAKHPLMFETGSLMNSIKWKMVDNGVLIYTDPSSFSDTKRHQGFCYAAVHNAPDSLNTRTGNVKNMPRRQFMGHSSILDEELKKLTDIIFTGFPK